MNFFTDHGHTHCGRAQLQQKRLDERTACGSGERSNCPALLAKPKRRRKAVSPNDATGELVEIVGIAKTSSISGSAKLQWNTCTCPLAQNPQPRMTLLAQSSGDAASLISGLRGRMVRVWMQTSLSMTFGTMRDFYQIRAISTPNMINQIVRAMGLIGFCGSGGIVRSSVLFGGPAVPAKSGSAWRSARIRHRLFVWFCGKGWFWWQSVLALGLVGSSIAEIGVKAVFSSTERDPLAY